MTAYHNQNRALTYRRALEALRSGVPNREAVSILGCNQPEAERRFADLLANAPDASGALGMLVSGGFGVGKSHLLTHLEHQALLQGFVCSRVTISKETPLYDLGKVFKSAVDNGRMPNRNGRLIEELGLALKPDSVEYASFYQWANNQASEDPGRLSPMFPAGLLVHERARDLELNSEIEEFWAGDPIKISTIKGGLKQIGQLKSYSFRAPKAAELPPQRLRFVTELIKSVGYKGWVVLLDEIELVGSYSLLQRGKSYAELARWLGQTHGEAYPGLVAVGAVTDDFASAILGGSPGKEDLDRAGQRLRGKGNDALAARADTGMRLLERECISLGSPTDVDMNATIEKLREMYTEAYGWDAPRLQAKMGEVGERSRMRYRVRSSVSEWDIRRLYPDSHPETVIAEFRPTYAEEPDRERESEDDDDSQPPTTVD